MKTKRLENRTRYSQVTKKVMPQALQDCPNSGVLWPEAIFMESQRKLVSIVALISPTITR